MVRGERKMLSLPESTDPLMTPNTLRTDLFARMLLTSTVMFFWPPSLYITDFRPPIKLLFVLIGPPMFLGEWKEG